jgi:hypothetical protein
VKGVSSLQTGLGLTIVVLLVGISGCCGVLLCASPPAALCEIETLLVDEAVFPEGWTQQGIPDSRGAPASFGVERIGIGFSTRIRGVAGQAVYRAFDIRAAVAGYRDFMSYFSVREGETEWSLPTEFTWRSQIADQFRLGCSTHRSSGVQRCQFIGQYDVYLVRFHTYMSSDLMTYEDLECILQDIDLRMAECLDR